MRLHVAASVADPSGQQQYLMLTINSYLWINSDINHMQEWHCQYCDMQGGATSQELFHLLLAELDGGLRDETVTTISQCKEDLEAYKWQCVSVHVLYLSIWKPWCLFPIKEFWHGIFMSILHRHLFTVECWTPVFFIWPRQCFLIFQCLPPLLPQYAH